MSTTDFKKLAQTLRETADDTNVQWKALLQDCQLKKKNNLTFYLNMRCLNKPLADAELPTTHEITLEQEPIVQIVYDFS